MQPAAANLLVCLLALSRLGFAQVPPKAQGKKKNNSSRRKKFGGRGDSDQRLLVMEFKKYIFAADRKQIVQ